MPPKKKMQDVPSGNLVPQWCFRNDTRVPDSDPSAWTPYSPAQSEGIEAAFKKGLKTADIGAYFVDTKQNVQMQKADPLKSRKIRRRMVPAEQQASAERQAQVVVVSPQDVRSIDAPDEPVLKKARAESALTPPLLPPLAGTAAPLTVPAVRTTPPTVPVPHGLSLSSSAPLTTSSGIAPPATPLLKTRVPSKEIKFSCRSEALLQPIVFLPALVDPGIISMIELVFKLVPSINRGKLDNASVLIAPTRRWLQSLGRPEKEQGVFITLPQGLNHLKESQRVPVSSSAVMTVAQAKLLADHSLITYVGKRPESVLLPNEKQSKHESLSYKDHLKTQQLMISGWVRILYDGQYKPFSKPPAVVSCSVPGINFAYSSIDRHYYFRQCDDEEESKTVMDEDKALTRMRLIWQHLLLVMDEKYRVEYPVLCAIGCGAFKGVYGAKIPRMWAKALAQVVCNSAKVLRHIKAIFISLPTFGSDNNFAPFQHAIGEVLHHQGADVQHAPIVLLEDASMIDIAATIASMPSAGDEGVGSSPVVGILNPSDVQAIRHGWVGMYWDGGHIALEEVLAMQTTLLLHHVGLNRSLFTDPKRLVGIKKVLPDMQEE